MLKKIANKTVNEIKEFHYIQRRAAVELGDVVSQYKGTVNKWRIIMFCFYLSKWEDSWIFHSNSLQCLSTHATNKTISWAANKSTIMWKDSIPQQLCCYLVSLSLTSISSSSGSRSFSLCRSWVCDKMD